MACERAASDNCHHCTRGQGWTTPVAHDVVLRVVPVLWEQRSQRWVTLATDCVFLRFGCSVLDFFFTHPYYQVTEARLEATEVVALR